MNIRPYNKDDLSECLAILTSNVPEYFVAGDRQELTDFLTNSEDPYLVGEQDGKLVACGGWYVNNDGIGGLTWGMVSKPFHAQGLGEQLLQYRLQCLRQHGKCHTIKINTAQVVQGFFARHGFKVVEITPDGFGPGLDWVVMTLDLSEEATDG